MKRRWEIKDQTTFDIKPDATSSLLAYFAQYLYRIIIQINPDLFKAFTI